MSDGRKLTIDDIARELGVSKTTVSRAISGKGRIGAKTRERVLRYIEAHDYRPNVIAKGLAQSRTYNICLVIPGDYNIVELPFFQNCMMGISKVASSMDYDVLLSIVTEEDMSQLRRVITNHKVDGVILTRTLKQDVVVEYLRGTKIPFVTIGTVEEEKAIQIDNDHRKACRELTELLLTKKSQRIALIGGNRNYMVTQNRLQGFLDACQNSVFKPHKSDVYLDMEDERSIAQIVENLLTEGIDCIITMDDYICSCVLNKLRQKKVAVPETVKVASFYDSSFLENSTPSVTSIQFNVEELGEVTCKTLLHMIEGEEVPERRLLGYQLSVRETTADTDNAFVQNT